MDKKISYQQLPLFEEFVDEEACDDFVEEPISRIGPRYEDAERIIGLLTTLVSRNYTRREIFDRIPGYGERIDGSDEEDFGASLERARKKLERDLSFLERMGYAIDKSGRGMDTIYHIGKGKHASINLFFDQSEVTTLSWLFTLFLTPTPQKQYTPRDVIPQQQYRHPFAEDILALISRFVATLPPDQKRYFDSLIQRPAIYFNLHAAVDYSSSRATIDKIIQAIGLGRRIRFLYSAGYRSQGFLHDEVDPHYITYQDGHFYLLGYSYQKSAFFELRLDRIDASSVELRRESINRVQPQAAITFRYWAEEKLAKGELSQRWLSYEIEQRDVYFQDEKGKRRGVIVKATAHNRWRIVQQLHKYADTVRLLDPPQLCAQMKVEIEHMHLMYESGHILS